MKLFLLAALISCQVFASAISSGGANCSNVADGLVYKASGGLCTWSSVAGTGDFVGPGSSTDMGFVRFSGTTGKAGQNTGTGATLSDTGTGTFAQVIDSGLTANTVAYANGSKQLTSSSVTPTELGYVSGVTSAIQTQLGTKAPLDSPAFTTQLTCSYATASTVPYWDGSKNLVSSSVTPTELGYVHNVTSAIQTQLNAKAPSASPTFTGTVTLPSGSVTSSAWDTGSSDLTVNSVAFSTKMGVTSGQTGFVEEWPIGEGLTATSIGNDTYPIIPYSALGRKVVSIRAACGTSGTITAKLQIDGVDITTCTGISVSSTPGTTTCDTGSTSTLAANSALTLVLSSNSSCTGFYAHVKTTRQ